MIALAHHATHSLAEELLAMGSVLGLRLGRLVHSLYLNSTNSKTLSITRPSNYWRLPLLRGGPVPALALPGLVTRLVGV